MNEFEKMNSGLEFDATSPEFAKLRNEAFDLLKEINSRQFEAGKPYVAKLLKHVGENTVVCPPFLCEYGKSISIGSNTYINMGATMLDNAPIKIGNHVLIGPNAQFYTPTHSLDHQQRKNWEFQCLPIIVEDDVWIGGNVVICQGVTIGARSVVAAGAVVTKDVAPDTLVGGVPAQFIKALDNNN
ncbi:sugar O-acetyltransferase [Vibrio ruber]|uniref:Nodulation protein L n=1 Tax=Vibrio ruber (strain DSM 16370 / JCM 11486 / BCRC 17186 / CECT 7878 / LMG 23124 / VR1) TaxID=1123498 RepID=A0A1R4LFX9_VIBR1|nr:sugar O-acetyltransferase [Vibrio ruber]WNJ97930.1 sugar O-acetyltransferase [Vibrio ruber]SJN55343.1 Galactoside O-acetyltransferase [Vibrio ruber DSM 16370]